MTKDVENESDIFRVKNGKTYKRGEMSLFEDKGNNKEL